MAFWWILVAGLIAVGIWGLLKSARGPGGSGDSPERILRRRFAKGELDQATFQRMLTELKERTGAGS